MTDIEARQREEALHQAIRMDLPPDPDKVVAAAAKFYAFLCGDEVDEASK